MQNTQWQLYGYRCSSCEKKGFQFKFCNIPQKNFFLKKEQTYETISSAILTPNFPTHVPPYFCTSHLASGSMVFWCKFGGVLGGEGDNEDDLEDNGDGVDILEVV